MMVAESVSTQNNMHLAPVPMRDDFDGESTYVAARAQTVTLRQHPCVSHLPDISDESALVAAAQKDPAAFEPLYERYVDQIYRYTYRRVGNHAEAEDLTAQTFQQALSALPRYEWRGLPFGAWLYRIAGNLIIRHRRTRTREIAVEDVASYHVEHEWGDDLFDIVASRESSSTLVDAVRRLPADQQRALVLKYARGLKNHEVGAVMGRSEGAIKQLVHRAISALRASLLSDEAALTG
jgi:RNA polymerase sigma-70 factor, ECF subfamily